MNDTPPEIATVYREMLMARSGQERFRMGLEMFELARAMMLVGLEGKGGDVSQDRAFRRFYADDFTEEEFRRILRRLAASQS
jgi:hypothetical protein